MNFLTLRSLTVDLLPAVVELDRRCLNGLWSIEGYRREIESPNSDLLVLQRGASEKEAIEKDAITPLGDCEACARVDAGVEAPQPPNSGGLPSRQTDASSGFTDEEFNRFYSASRSQSPPSLQRSGSLQGGDVGGEKNQTPNQIPSLIGLGCLWSIAEEAHITILAIDPDYRQLGLGQAILYALLVSAHHRGLEWATLEVRAGNTTAIRLYEKFGFGSVGRRKGYYPDGEDALILWRSGLQKPEFCLWMQETERQIGDRLRKSNYEILLEPTLQPAFG